jgi:hypothetical protein
VQLKEGHNIIKTQAKGYARINDCSQIKNIQFIGVSYLSTYSNVYGTNYPGFKLGQENVRPSDLNDAKRSFPVIQSETLPVTCIEN